MMNRQQSYCRKSAPRQSQLETIVGLIVTPTNTMYRLLAHLFLLCYVSIILFLVLLSISALLCKIAALRSFSLDKLQYWRESASGISSLAHFLAKDTIDHFNTVIKPAVYLSMFYFFSNPRSSFAENYIVLLCLVYCVTGIGYTLAIFLEPGPSQLVN